MKADRQPQHTPRTGNSIYIHFRWHVGAMFTGLLLVPSTCRQVPSTSLVSVSRRLSFRHQAEFAGLYAADQLGFLSAEGLQVSFIEGGPEVDFITPVVEGTAQFGNALPGMNSPESASQIRTLYPESKIVMFSIHDEPQFQNDPRKAGHPLFSRNPLRLGIFSNLEKLLEVDGEP